MGLNKEIINLIRSLMNMKLVRSSTNLVKSIMILAKSIINLVSLVMSFVNSLMNLVRLVMI